MLKVIKAGLWTSVQDLGRIGYRHFGIPVAGVMDARSARLANLLLNNSVDAAVLEITMMGPELEFTQSTRISLTGADISPQLNGQACAMNKVIEISIGDQLKFGSLNYGLRTYLAIEQGFQTSQIMGSRSSYENITPTKKVAKGDVIKYLKPSHLNEQTERRPSHAAVKVNHLHFEMQSLHVYPGPEFEDLSDIQKQQLMNKTFTVSSKNNRMAYQIEEMLENSLESILTSAVMPGTVQLTPSGKLIVLMRDCQTTGGYPRILQLSEQAISQLAQKRQGDALIFDLI